MAGKFKPAEVIAGAILLDYPKLSIEQIVQMLETGQPAFVRTHAEQRTHPAHKLVRPTQTAAIHH
jgi:hypothetical protein